VRGKAPALLLGFCCVLGGKFVLFSTYYMKSVLAIIIGASFILGGFAMVSMASEHGEMVSCPFSQAANGSCHLVNGLETALHHIGGLQSLMNVPLVLLATLVLLLLSSVAIAVLCFCCRSIGIFLYKFSSASGKRTNELGIPIFNIPLRWAELHNKSGRVCV